jgi:hypothetical protein
VTAIEEIQNLWLTATRENIRDHLRRAIVLAQANGGDGGGYIEGLTMLFMAHCPGEPFPEQGDDASHP